MAEKSAHGIPRQASEPGRRNASLTVPVDKGLMRRFATAALFLAFAGHFVAGAAASDPQVAFGRELAEDNCVQCHAILTDDTSHHPEAPPLRELSARYPLEALEEAFVEGISVGHPDMPEFEASPEQVGALMAYLHTIQDAAP